MKHITIKIGDLFKALSVGNIQYEIPYENTREIYVRTPNGDYQHINWFVRKHHDAVKLNLSSGNNIIASTRHLISSNGQMMSQLNRARWAVDGPIAVDQMSDYELESLNVMAGSPSLGIWQFAMISGAIYKGTGRPVGDVATDSNAGTLTLKVAGGGYLQKI
jgi:hypothetical protein